MNVTAWMAEDSQNNAFEIKDGIEANDDTRLRYRPLTFVVQRCWKTLNFVAKVTPLSSNHLDELEFIDVETPFSF